MAFLDSDADQCRKHRFRGRPRREGRGFIGIQPVFLMRDRTPMHDQKDCRLGPGQKRGQVAALPVEGVGFRQWLRRVVEGPDGLAACNGPGREDPPHVAKILDPVAFGKQREG